MMQTAPPSHAVTELDIAREFDLDPGLCHLNHAGIGPWPSRAVHAVQRFAQDNGRRGSEDYPDWLAVDQSLRARLARLIGAADPDDIALAKSTSEALSVIAQGLPWEAGDEIVGIAEEFPSNRIVWEALGERGVRWRGLSIANSADPESDLLGLCTERTRLVAVSWVQYARGLRLDLHRLARACRQRGILVCVDAIQGLGALPFDLHELPVDFVVADGHKWMLGPEGIALLYIRPSLRDRLRLLQFGWNMVEDRGDYERTDWQPASSARRFECGSPNLLGIHGLEASLSVLEDVGIERIAAAIDERVRQVIQCVDERGFKLLSPREPARLGGIVTFAVPDRDPSWIYRGLMAQRVLCAQRGGGIRFSAHFYTPHSAIESAFERLDALISGDVAPTHAR
jgi:selenocysteine lyase/cysteine desulfurase